MAKQERKRRFLTLELCPCMSDQDEKRFKDTVAQAIKSLRFANDKQALFIPKKALRTKFDGDSDIVVVSSKVDIQKLRNFI